LKSRLTKTKIRKIFWAHAYETVMVTESPDVSAALDRKSYGHIDFLLL